MRNHSLTIVTIFGTRPEVIKLFPVLKKLEQCENIKSIVVSTSQHREMIDDLLKVFSIQLDHDLDIIQDNQSLIDISIRVLSGLDSVMKQHRPDMVLVQGDTTTAFVGALAAFYCRIPIGHVEAGLRSFNKMHPYPEEINRRLISVVGDQYFTPTVQNAQNLYAEGVESSRVFVTGNTVIDSLQYIVRNNRNILDNYLPAHVLNGKRMILITAHRRENWGNPLENLCLALIDLVEKFPDVQIVYPVHLNPNVRKIVHKMLANHDRIHLLDPLPYEPFVEAMTKAHIIVTDSGGIQEEGPSLHKPILVFRKVTERPEGLDTGGVKLVGLKRGRIFKEVSKLLEDGVAYQEMITEQSPYGDGRAAERIIQAILHYFGFANRPDNFIFNGK